MKVEIDRSEHDEIMVLLDMNTILSSWKMICKEYFSYSLAGDRNSKNRPVKSSWRYKSLQDWIKERLMYEFRAPDVLRNQASQKCFLSDSDHYIHRPCRSETTQFRIKGASTIRTLPLKWQQFALRVIAFLVCYNNYILSRPLLTWMVRYLQRLGIRSFNEEQIAKEKLILCSNFWREVWRHSPRFPISSLSLLFCWKIY